MSPDDGYATARDIRRLVGTGIRIFLAHDVDPAFRRRWIADVSSDPLVAGQVLGFALGYMAFDLESQAKAAGANTLEFVERWATTGTEVDD